MKVIDNVWYRAFKVFVIITAVTLTLLILSIYTLGIINDYPFQTYSIETECYNIELDFEYTNTVELSKIPKTGYSLCSNYNDTALSWNVVNTRQRYSYISYTAITMASLLTVFGLSYLLHWIVLYIVYGNRK